MKNQLALTNLDGLDQRTKLKNQLAVVLALTKPDPQTKLMNQLEIPQTLTKTDLQTKSETPLSQLCLPINPDVSHSITFVRMFTYQTRFRP
jgi:hypothetical protein